MMKFLIAFSLSIIISSAFHSLTKLRSQGIESQPLRLTLQSSGVTARLRGLSAVNDQVAWASGSGSTVLRTADGGVTWVQLSVTTDQLDFRDTDAVDETTAYVLAIGNGSASRIYKTTNSGASWTLQFKNEEQRAFLDAMSFWDPDHGIVIGDSIDGQFFVLATENGGKLWSRVPASALPSAIENEGAFAASGTNIATVGSSRAWIGLGAATKARVLRTVDGGRSWKISDTPVSAGPSAGIFSIVFRDAKHGVIVGGDYRKESEANDNLALTEDGGITWSLAKGISGFRSAVVYVSASKMLVATGPSGTDYSNDEGRNWKHLEGQGFDTLSFARGASIGWAAGSEGRLGRLELKR